MAILGYISSILIGISLGLIGGGGSILTVPVLVYIFHLSPAVSTSYSLFIVGVTSGVGLIEHYKRKQIHYPTALTLGATSILTVLLTRLYILPAIPDSLFEISDFTITKSMATMVLFAGLMLPAAWSMIKPSKPTVVSGTYNQSYVHLTLYGIVIGLVTGFMGAGGGFLLIPALVLLAKLPIKKAIGTSLLLIAANSLIGFIGDLDHLAIDWSFLIQITLLAVGGILFGARMGKNINGEKLKKGFGWFILLMSIYILILEIFK